MPLRSKATELSAQQQAIAERKATLHDNVTERIVRMFEAIRNYGDPRVQVTRAALFTKTKGVIRGRGFRAVVCAPTYLTIYELTDANICNTDDWKARRNMDAMTEWLRGKALLAKGSSGIYAKILQ